MRTPDDPSSGSATSATCRFSAGPGSLRTTAFMEMTLRLFPRERLAGGDPFDRDFRNECLQPIGAQLHARIFRNGMADGNHRFRLSARHEIVRVVHALPLSLFAGDDQIDLGKQARSADV